MRPLRVRIDVTEGTATPAQPDPTDDSPECSPNTAATGKAAARARSSSSPTSGSRGVRSFSPFTQGGHQPSVSVIAQGRLLTETESITPPPTASRPAQTPGSPPASTNLAHPHTASCARLLQTADITPETARLVRCHNPWPSEDVLFCPDGALPAFVTGIPALSSGPELWYAVHNHRPEPLQLHAGQSIGVLEVVQLAEAPASAPPSSMHPTSSPC